MHLLELILVKKIMMQTMKLVEYKRLSISLKIKENEVKQLEHETNKLKLQLTNLNVENNVNDK